MCSFCASKNAMFMLRKKKQAIHVHAVTSNRTLVERLRSFTSRNLQGNIDGNTFYSAWKLLLLLHSWWVNKIRDSGKGEGLWRSGWSEEQPAVGARNTLRRKKSMALFNLPRQKDCLNSSGMYMSAFCSVGQCVLASSVHTRATECTQGHLL